VLRKSRFGNRANLNDFMGFTAKRQGQNCPQEKPQPGAGGSGPETDALGDPIGIREVAELIGCSVWTVRQQCIRQGLPHFRVNRTGKLIFYRSQVVRWLFDKQQERRW